MIRRALYTGLLLTLALSADVGRAAQDPSLAQGIAQVNQGDLEAGIATLNAAIRKLSGTPGATKDIAQAHLYIGVAQLGLRREEAAKAEFRKAVALDRELRVSASQFSPRVVNAFKAAGGRSAAAQKRQASGSRSNLFLGVGAAAVSGGLAVAATREGTDPFRTDDDGDGLTEEQGDCNDFDPRVNPSGKIEATFVIGAQGALRCSSPPSGAFDQVVIKNNTCTNHQLTILTQRSQTSSSCPLGVSAFTLPSRIVTVNAGVETTTFLSSFGTSLACRFGTLVNRSGTCSYEDNYTLISPTGNVQSKRSYSFEWAECPVCGF